MRRETMQGVLRYECLNSGASGRCGRDGAPARRAPGPAGIGGEPRKTAPCPLGGGRGEGAWDRRPERLLPRNRSEDGLAAVEFAIVAPLLLLMMFGAVTFAHALYIRHRLAAETYNVARTCAVTEASEADCEAYAASRLEEAVGSACGIEATAGVVPLTQGSQPMQAARVEATCEYAGLVGTEYLQSEGISIRNFTVSAVVPY